MRKIIITLFFSLILCNATFAENYYFKNCIIDDKYTADYLINFQSNVISINFHGGDVIQTKEYKIDTITEDKITTEKKQNVERKQYFFQYYLDSNTGSVSMQRYIKKTPNDLFRADGPTRRHYCENIKADWAKIKKKQTQKKQKKSTKTQNSLTECVGSDHKKWTDCRGSHLDNNCFKYNGVYKQGKIIKGTAIFPGGGKYVGDFKLGLPNGYGTFSFPDESQYFGEWKNGKGEGQGIKTWKDGRKYSGSFKDDKPHGEGIFEYPDGSKYTGELKNGKRHGQGTLIYSNGETYIGKFIDGYESEKKNVSLTTEEKQKNLDVVKDCSKLKMFSHKWTLCKLGRLN